MWSPPFSRPTRRRRHIHINLADFTPHLNSFSLPSHGRASFARPGPIPRQGQLPPWPAARARRLKADLTSSQPTKDDHRGNQTEQNGNRDATETRVRVWRFSPPCSRARCPDGMVLLTAGEG